MINESFCPAPWLSFYVSPDGDVRNCCVSRKILGNVNNETIDNIIHGSANRKIKEDMLAGKNAEGCENCFNQAKGNRLQDGFKSLYKDISEDFFKDLNNFDFRYLDLRWNNTCNYGCVYCSPLFSSLWESDIVKFDETQNKKIIKISEKTKKIDYFLENLANVNYVYLAGGEPLMIKENEIILSKLLEVAPATRIVVNTNLSLIENNKIFDLLLQFKNLQWLISAEDTGSRYEYIRWPGTWETFNNNLKTLKNINRGDISFNSVLMNINALTIWDFIDYVHDEFDVLHENITINIYNSRDSSGPLSI